tara:strand:+ start:91 stop:219 length:129 start_codon:yes stop_codon:yes gene_type:complete
MSIIAAVMVGLSFLLTALSTPVCEYDVEDVEVYENKEGHIKD